MALNPTATLDLTVVAADRVVWQGEAKSLVARTTEGDIGILPNHEPLLAALVPCAVTIVESDGSTHILVVDGGFISVADNKVSLLSQFAELASEVDSAQATRDADAARAELERGDSDPAVLLQRDLAVAKLSAVELAGRRS